MMPFPLSNYPFRILLKKPFSKGKEIFQKRLDRKRYGQKEQRNFSDHGPIRTFVPSLLESDGSSGVDREKRKAILRGYEDHCFDVLGSGWIEWSYTTGARGMEGFLWDRRVFFDTEPSIEERVGLLSKPHQERAAKILRSFTRESYSPIDWQRDMRSGFRWDESLPAVDQHRLHQAYPGADPKVPFEMGRLQHLPRMALLVKDLEKEERRWWIRDFKEQVADFIAMNPPGMGINWSCSMDVGIRTANLLLAYDLFRSIDETELLDKDFHRCFSDSIQQHAEYLEQHLEYQDGLTGNHYLFNIAGLLFVSAYMPEAPGSNRRLQFAIHELIRELFKQFLPEGGNFEGSTAYHRLSTEMFVYSSSLILGLSERLLEMEHDLSIPMSKWSHGISGRLHSTPEKPLPRSFIDRLKRAMALNERLTKPNGRHAQIGDNDSGVFFRLTPEGSIRSGKELNERYVERAEPESVEAFFFDEDLLSMAGTEQAIKGMRGEGDTGRFEGELVRSFMNGAEPLGEADREELRLKGEDLKIGDALPHEETERIPFPRSLELSKGGWVGDLEAGWIVYDHPDCFLLLNAPPGTSLRHTWGHVHNDRASVELYAGGKELLIDPGSYLYEAVPEWRNRFRSVKAHNVPVVKGMEQNRWRTGKKGLFTLYPESRCELLSLTEHSAQIRVLYRGIEHVRELSLDEEGVQIRDRCSHPFELELFQRECFSQGYGKRLKKTPL